MKNLAIIPARGGSKRIKNKNIRDFLGKPIIGYSIQTALESELFDEIMVSTDDEEIAKVSKEYGATVPFMRSDRNSDDMATIADAMLEVVEYYSTLGKLPENICCIFSTAPLILPSMLNKAYELLNTEKCDSVVSVSKFTYPIQRAIRRNKHGFIEMIYPEYARSRSQDLPEVYHDAGQFYWAKTKKFIKEKRFMSTRSKMYVLGECEAQDIDTIEDWHLAELKYNLRIEKARKDIY